MKRIAFGLFLLLAVSQQAPLAAAQKLRPSVVRSSVVHPPDPLGTIVASTVACPDDKIKPAACYALDISCPSIPDYTAYVKIVTPPNPVGTVMLTTGGDTNALYEDLFTYGSVTVSDLIGAQFTTVELTFGMPFSSAPGWQWDVGGAGVRAASCRYATVAQWVHDKAADVPLCATGVSAGGQQLSEGLAHYGLGDILAFAEITSGPPFGRVDYACINNLPPAVEYCSGTDAPIGVGFGNAVDFVDPAYPGPWCSSALRTHSTEHEQQFLSDSVEAPDATLSYPSTNVRFLFGGQDFSSAIRQGLIYQSLITTPTSYGCVKDAPHMMPDVQDAAEQIATDLIANCHR